jgi:hypothetical protein
MDDDGDDNVNCKIKDLWNLSRIKSKILGYRRIS